MTSSVQRSLAALVVEDEAAVAGRIVEDLTTMGFAKAYVAPTVAAAWTLFQAHPDIALILMDGELPAGGPPWNDPHAEPPITALLVMRIREWGFQGHMIAVSTEFQEPLLRAGCNHSCGKWEASTLVAHLFDLPPPRLPGSRLV